MTEKCCNTCLHNPVGTCMHPDPKCGPGDYQSWGSIESINSGSFQAHVAGWANDRKLYETATPYTQMFKLLEEIIEWMKEVNSGDRDAEKIELGDMLVVLANIAEMRGFNLEECGWAAFDKIKNRKGKMVNGTFVKEGA